MKDKVNFFLAKSDIDYQVKENNYFKILSEEKEELNNTSLIGYSRNYCYNKNGNQNKQSRILSFVCLFKQQEHCE